MWSPIAPSLHLSSFIWTTHRTINGSTSRFHLGVSTLSYPFQHALWQDIWNSLCPNFIMFWPSGECLVYNSTNLPRLSINFLSLSHNISYTTWSPIPQLQAFIDVCAHIPLTLWVYTSHFVFMAMSAHEPMMHFATSLLPLCKMLASTWGNKNHMHFLQTCSTPIVNKSMLCSSKITFSP